MKKILLATAALLTVTACSSQLGMLKIAEPKGDQFSQALVKEYIMLSESEAYQYDWKDSEYFAGKGLAAASGQNVEPEKLEMRDLPEDAIIELATNRERLVRALSNPKIRANSPDDLAYAQSSFDCWVEQREEVWQGNEYIKCKSEFQQTISDLLSVKSGMILFAPGSSAISPRGNALLNAVAGKLRGNPSTTALVTGHTDTVGDAQANQLLSEKRARAVASGIIARGIDPARVKVAAEGEGRNRVQTGDETSAQYNRRVEIFLD